MPPENSTSNYPNRKSPRADFHDYSGGDYFITICTEGKAHFFGEIKNNSLFPSRIGKVVHEKIESIPKHYPYAKILNYVVMPNHIHAIIRIDESSDASGCVPTSRSALSVVVGGFKQSVTVFARRNNISFGWQSRYHDHIIRNEKDALKISTYIDNNIAFWDNDCFNMQRASEKP
ncbi:MAG: transposase [Muribaculaceae bacterium]|nr:transposase [Muribaculaceae bacterium]